LYSRIHNSWLNHLRNTAKQFVGYLEPFIENFGTNSTVRTSNGLQSVKDYYLGRLGPGTFWEDLNSLHYSHPIWDPESDWNSIG
ncbi:MAG: hypothetical protein ABEI86_10700, partial [Halobacteriaceae archaeon]